MAPLARNETDEFILDVVSLLNSKVKDLPITVTNLEPIDLSMTFATRARQETEYLHCPLHCLTDLGSLAIFRCACRRRLGVDLVPQYQFRIKTPAEFDAPRTFLVVEECLNCWQQRFRRQPSAVLRQWKMLSLFSAQIQSPRHPVVTSLLEVHCGTDGTYLSDRSVED